MEYAQISKEQIIKTLQFYDDKIKSWADIAPIVILASEQNFNFDSIEYDKRKISSIIRAYNFLEVQRSEWLKDPKITDVKPEYVSYLPFIFKRMDKDARETKFQKLIDDVLEGRVKKTELISISKKYKIKKVLNGNSYPIIHTLTKNLNDVESIKDETSIETFKSAIKILSFVIDKTKGELSIEYLRKVLGKDCRNLANELQCIADEDFEKLWKERKEFGV